MRKWSGSLVVVALGLASACAGAGGETSQDNPAVRAGAAGVSGTGGTDIGVVGAGGFLAAGGTSPQGNARAGAGGASGPAAGGGGPIGVGGAAVPGGTLGNGGAPQIGSPAGGAGPIETGGAGGMDPVAAGGTDPMGVGGFDNGGNPFIRGPNPTIESATAEGPYTVESYASGFAIGPDFPGGTIWYPTDAEVPFASIAIVPGFVSPRVLIEAWGPFLASHGIVTFTIDTNAVTDQPAARSRALLNALESLAAEHTRTGSPLAGKLDNERQAVGGHSMGGGGTLITVNGNPRLKAGIPMCPWNPGATFPRNSVPTLLFASAGDPLAGGQSQGFYRSIPSSTPKLLFEWGAADHFMANAPTGAAGQVGRYALSWLKVFLEGDERYRQFLEQDCDGCTDFQSSL